MFCPNCGKDAGESKFCPECGAKVEVVRASEEAKVDSGKNSEVKEAVNEAAGKEKKKMGKGAKRLIGCFTPIIIILLIVAGVYAFFEIKSMGPAEKLDFNKMASAYSENASKANDKYSDKKYTFYFIPEVIETSGTCTGKLYDSHGNLWKLRSSGEISIHLGDDANSLKKGQLYEVEGVFKINYTDSGYFSGGIWSAEVVDKNPDVTLEDD